MSLTKNIPHRKLLSLTLSDWVRPRKKSDYLEIFPQGRTPPCKNSLSKKYCFFCILGPKGKVHKKHVIVQAPPFPPSPQNISFLFCQKREKKLHKSLKKYPKFCRKSVSEAKNMFIKHLLHFFTTLCHIFKAFALCDKIEQSKVDSFRVLRL